MKELKKIIALFLSMFMLVTINLEANKDILDEGMALGGVSFRDSEDNDNFFAPKFSTYYMSGRKSRGGYEISTISLVFIEINGRVGYALGSNMDIWVSGGGGTVMFAGLFLDYGVGMHYAFTNNLGLIVDVKKYNMINNKELDQDVTKQFTSYGVKVSFDF